ncbi:MAG: hypothetical protein EPN97_09315 [Alphaproteobacteria bacterium]|nr:MAG: hypothetical protein EPN97_09315 [Alphaproteobacteria bacterium]
MTDADDWKRKYLVIAEKAPPAMTEAPKKKEQPAAIPAAEKPAPAPTAEDKPKKSARKRSIKKEFNDAAEKPKKAFPKRKPVRKTKLT